MALHDQYGTLRDKMALLVELGKELGRAEKDPKALGSRGPEIIKNRIEELKEQIQRIAEK